MLFSQTFDFYILHYKDFKEFHPLWQGQQKRHVTTMADHLEFYTGLRGFHVYSTTVNWRPYVGQKLIFKRELDNHHDKFAVAGKTMLKGKIGLIIVGHIPRELSHYTWYSIQEGAKFEAEVHEAKPKLSPLVQGGLEIPMKVTVTLVKVEK